MLKKLLTFAAGVALCFSAQAARVVDYVIDYSNYDSFPFYVMGYTPDFIDGHMVSNNPMQINEETGEEEPAWYQYFVADGIQTEIAETYFVTVYAKASEKCSFNLNMGWGWGDGQQLGKTLTLGTDWAEVEITYEEIGGTSCNLVAQPGTNLATIEWAWIKVEHEEGEKQPEEWIDLLVNGDAEGEYGEIPCAYGKEYDDVNKLGTDPHPATIVPMDGGHVFVVNATAVDPKDFLNDDGSESGAHAWQNQFWIESPKSWNQNDIFRVSFDYKASKAANTNTQCHKQTPGDYLIWHAIGDVAFTTEWQHFEKKVTVEGDMAGMWSIAFNLNPQVYEAIDFYYDNLKWETLKLDEGYFVAGDFNDKSLKDAVEFVYNEDDETYWVEVGTDEKPASQIKISTRRGNDSAFNSNCIKVDDTLIVDDEDAWIDYVATGGAKWINLPEAAIWHIELDEAYGQIVFYTVEENGISSVSVDNNVAPVYYNLQGVRVDNPSNGIFIVKKGNKVSKQVIR